MGKYVQLEQDVFSIFASPEWQAEDIETYPTNYIAVKSSNHFIRVSVIPSGRGVNRYSAKGILIIDIFITAGKGIRKALEIADRLDAYLVNKSISTHTGSTTQFGFSSLAAGVDDKENLALYSNSYSITFDFFSSQT